MSTFLLGIRYFMQQTTSVLLFLSCALLYSCRYGILTTHKYINILCDELLSNDDFLHCVEIVPRAYNIIISTTILHLIWAQFPVRKEATFNLCKSVLAPLAPFESFGAQYCAFMVHANSIKTIQFIPEDLEATKLFASCSYILQ